MGVCRRVAAIEVVRGDAAPFSEKRSLRMPALEPPRLLDIGKEGNLLRARGEQCRDRIGGAEDVDDHHRTGEGFDTLETVVNRDSSPINHR